MLTFLFQRYHVGMYIHVSLRLDETGTMAYELLQLCPALVGLAWSEVASSLKDSGWSGHSFVWSGPWLRPKSADT